MAARNGQAPHWIFRLDVPQLLNAIRKITNRHDVRDMIWQDPENEKVPRRELWGDGQQGSGSLPVGRL